VIASVKKGEFVYVYADDCVERSYPAGAFIDPGGDNVHMAFNPSKDGKTVLVSTFFDAPETGPLTLSVPVEEAEALDERCGFASTSHSH
jgi:hypothetical protein